jgi:hypothetical protein
MRDSRRNYLFPLKVGVPYLMASGLRRVFDSMEDIAFNGYDGGTGENSSTRHFDIVEFCIEDGVWLTHEFGEVMVARRSEFGRGGEEYPYHAIPLKPKRKNFFNGFVTEHGYEFAHTEPSDRVRDLDIIGYVRPVSSDEAQNYVWFRDRVGADEYQLVHDDFPIAWDTGAHISTTEPDLLAYFPTQKHWDSRVPQKIKAGRYLKKYFPDMSDDWIRQKANLLTGNKRTLKVLTHWYDMFTAYRTLDTDGVVSSCMTKDCWRPVHPLMVYHESDVVLAVMYEGDVPKARALVNKNTKEFNIIYGQWERMLPMLEADGYSHGSLDGARINKLMRYASRDVDWDSLKESIEPIRTTDNVALLMPYIDGHRDHSRGHNNSTSVNVYSDYVEIDADGQFTANDHENASIGEEEERDCCGNCGEDYPQGDGYYLEHEGIDLCDYCYHNQTVRVVSYVHSTRGFSYESVTENYADNNCIWHEDSNEYYMDSSVLEQAGYVWSDYHDGYRDKDDCVCTVDGDWIDKDEEGIVFEYDETIGEYVLIPKDTKTRDIFTSAPSDNTTDHTIDLALAVALAA